MPRDPAEETVDPLRSALEADGRERRDPLGAMLTCGFGLAVLVWVVAFITHLPAFNLRGSLAGPIVLGAWVVGALFAGKAAAREGWMGTIGAGVLSAVLTLLLLGSLLVSPHADQSPPPGTSGLQPSAAVKAGGFLVLGGLIGVVAQFAAIYLRWGAVEAKSPRPDWVARFAVVACVAVVPLLMLGGAVTSTDSGLAVPDWPRTYNANMFLYPLALMSDPGIFLEHTHRLMGSLVGLTAFTLMVLVLLRESRAGVKWFAVTMFALVVGQGILGGIRVTEASRGLAIVHGITAQVFFALMVGLAVVLSPGYRATPPLPPGIQIPNTRKLRRFATAALHSTVLQLVLGTVYRHLKAGGSPGASHALWTHAGFALIVLGAACAAGFLAIRVSRDAWVFSPVLRRAGWALLVTVVMQFILGWAALVAVLAHGPGGSVERPLGALVATLHQNNGALVLAAGMLLYVWVRRISAKVLPPSPV